MKKYLTLATAALLMAACSEKPGYTISGTVANADMNGKYVYLYEYGAKDAAPLDSALIANGQFSLTGSQDSPRLCELKVNTGDAGEQGYQTVFVLENGQLQARMDAKSSAVSGTALPSSAALFFPPLPQHLEGVLLLLGQGSILVVVLPSLRFLSKLIPG